MTRVRLELPGRAQCLSGGGRVGVAGNADINVIDGEGVSSGRIECGHRDRALLRDVGSPRRPNFRCHLSDLGNGDRFAHDKAVAAAVVLLNNP